MPSVFTHLAVGASLAAVLPRDQRTLGAGALLAFAAAAPDLDVIAFGMGIPYEHPLGHRGVTHSLPFAAAMALLSIPAWRRWLPASGGAAAHLTAARPTAAHLAAALTFVALASHGLLDSLTDAGKGIGLLIPFDTERYFAPWRPILTSPVSVERFFTGRGLVILKNEMRVVGVPLLAFVVAVLALRRTGTIR